MIDQQFTSADNAAHEATTARRSWRTCAGPTWTA